MTLVDDIPKEYKLYFNVALGIMFGGLLAFLVSLFFGDDSLLSASIIALVLGFFLSIIMAFGLTQKRMKSKKRIRTIIVKIILILLIAFSTYMIIFAWFYVEKSMNSRIMYIIQGIAVPSLIVCLVIADIMLERRRGKKTVKHEN